MKTNFKTDELKFNKTSKPYFRINLYGFNVEIRKINYEVDKKKFPLLAQTYPYYNSYVELKGLDIKMYNKLPCVTYRNKKWIGVDTAHSSNQEQTELERFIDTIIQISMVIEKYKRIMARRKRK